MNPTHREQQAYEALCNEDYRAARTMLQQCLQERDNFNIRHALGVCHFNAFLDAPDPAEVDLAIEQCTQASDYNDGHFDNSFILAQCFAAKFYLTGDHQFREQAIDFYRRSKELAHLRPGLDHAYLEGRVDVLIEELESL